jgi:hypothetical protein
MNDLVNYIQNYLKTPSTSVAVRTGGGHVAVPGRGLSAKQPHIIDGEFSEVPRGLGGPGGSVTSPGTGLQRTYGEFSEVPKELSGPGGSLARGVGSVASAAGASGGLASMANPLLAAIMGSIQGDTLNNHKGFFSDKGNEPPAPAGNVTSAPMPPVGVPRAGDPGAPSPPISGVSPGYQDPPAPAAQAASQLPWWATGDMTQMFPGAGPSAHVPMPRARPAQAPAAPAAPQAAPQESQPDTSFFMRNAMMMRDPATGELIDPSGAASVRGPDLISKMMKYLHDK